MRKIVVLDGYAANPGDLSWDEIASLGALSVFDRTAPEMVLNRCKNAEIVITNKTPLNQETLQKLPELKMISVLATGYNVVDIKAANRQNIVVSNVPGYSTQSVAQLVFAYILEFCHHVQRHTDAVKTGAWSQCKDFCFWNYPLVELEGKTLGIVGYGTIGKAVEKIALAYGMNVLKCASKPREGCTLLEDVLKNSDFITLHCPLTEQTNKLINRTTLELMKPGAFLINTSRGAVVDDEALAEAIQQGRIAGAAMDVLSNVEPPRQDNPMLHVENCFITPHLAWATLEARKRLLKVTYENILAFLSGNPINTVN